jgi:hypothetical protein
VGGCDGIVVGSFICGTTIAANVGSIVGLSIKIPGTTTSVGLVVGNVVDWIIGICRVGSSEGDSMIPSIAGD